MYIYFKQNKINYEIFGEGRPLVLLHGWGGKISSFVTVIDFFKTSRKVIVIDFSGFGKSDEPKDPFFLDDYVGSVYSVLEKENITDADVIAHSFGGRVALKILSERKELFKKAILCSAAGLKPRRGLKYFFSVSKYKLLKKLYKKNNKKLKRLEEKSGSDDYRLLSPCMKETFKNVVNEHLDYLLKEVFAQVLVVYGKNDKATPYYMAKKMYKKIANSDLLILNGGHFCYLFDSRKFNFATDYFLRN